MKEKNKRIYIDLTPETHKELKKAVGRIGIWGTQANLLRMGVRIVTNTISGRKEKAIEELNLIERMYERKEETT